MRRLSLLVLAPAVFVGTALTATPASAAPAAPTGLRQFAALGGVGLTWTAPAGTVTGFHVYRDGTQVADVTDLTAPLTTIDAGLAAGATATYTVAAYDGSGDGSTVPLDVTRPAADATVGTADAFVLEGSGQHYYMDAARAGDTVTLPSDVLTGTVGGTTHGTATLPLVAGPGSYSSDAAPVALTIDGTSCPFTGTVQVREAAFDADLHPLTYAAELTGTCGGSPVTAALRWASDVPYVAVSVSPEPVAPQSDPSTPASAPVTLTNKGLSPLAVGTVGVSGTDAAEYTAGAGTCTSPVAADASCTLDVGFTPTAYGTRPAQLDLTLGALAQPRTVSLAGIGGHLPGVVQNVVVTKAYHRNLVTWSAPSTTGTPTVSYRVYPNYGASPSTFTAVSGTSFLDTTIGATSQYRIVAVNPAGTGPAYDVDAAPNATSAVLEISGTPGSSGLYMLADSGTPQSVRVPFLADATQRYGVAVSPDGNKVAYSQVNGSNSDIYVANLTGTPAPVRLTSLAGDEEDAAWSPDGKSIAFTYYTDTTVDVRTVAATGGTPVRRIANYEHPSWLADSSRLVADEYDNMFLAVVDAAGKATKISGSDSGFGASVSPDGKTVAFIYEDPDTFQWIPAALPVAGGSKQLLSDSVDWFDLSWTPDGTRVLGERVAVNQPQAYGMAFNGTTLSAPSALTTAGPDGWPVLVRSKVHLTSFSAVTGANATIGFASSDPYVTCTFDALAAAPCTTSYAATGLAAGKHALVVRSYSAPGGTLLSMTAAEFTVDRSVPTIAITSPTGNTAGLATTASIAYRGADTGGAGVLNYDVRYRRASGNGNYGAYSSPSGWLATTATSRAVAASPGYEYCFSVRVRDRVGNVSAWTADRCTDVAIDDRSMAASAGWSRVTSAGNYRSTVTQTTKTGTSLSLGAVQTRRVTLIVTRCASCGQVNVYLAGVRIGTVSTYAPTTQHQVRLALPLQAGVRSGSLILKPVTAGKSVVIDGVALGRA